MSGRQSIAQVITMKIAKPLRGSDLCGQSDSCVAGADPAGGDH